MVTYTHFVLGASCALCTHLLAPRVHVDRYILAWVHVGKYSVSRYQLIFFYILSCFSLTYSFFVCKYIYYRFFAKSSLFGRSKDVKKSFSTSLVEANSEERVDLCALWGSHDHYRLLWPLIIEVRSPRCCVCDCYDCISHISHTPAPATGLVIHPPPPPPPAGQVKSTLVSPPSAQCWVNVINPKHC